MLEFYAINGDVQTGNFNIIKKKILITIKKAVVMSLVIGGRIFQNKQLSQWIFSYIGNFFF